MNHRTVRENGNPPFACARESRDTPLSCPHLSGPVHRDGEDSLGCVGSILCYLLAAALTSRDATAFAARFTTGKGVGT